MYSYLLNDTLTYDGTFSQSTEWHYTASDTETESNPASLGDAIKQTYARVDKANKQIEMMVSDVDINSSNITNLMLNTEAISASVEQVKQVQEDSEAALQSVIDNVNTIASSVEAKMSAEDVQLEIKKELSNGVDKVTTSTGFTFDEEGLTVSKTGSEMETKITEDGMVVYKDSEAVLTANNTGVDAVNLHATTYLIIGLNSRTGLDTVTAGGVLVGAIGGFTMTSAGTEGQVLTSNGLNPPTWEDAGGGSGGGNTIGCIRVKCSSTSNLTIDTSTSWGDIEIPFDTVVFNYGEGLSLDSSSWHSIDCSENGYLEITGSAYFSGTSAYNKYMSLHLVSGNNTELISVKRSAMSGAMIIGPYIVPYSSSMRYFTLCARSDTTSPYIDLDNAATWFQVKYIAYT